LPDLETHVFQPFKDRGVLIYGLHGDEDPKLLSDFVEQTGVTFPLVHGQYTIIDFDFGFDGYPFPRQVVVDKQRRVRWMTNGLDVPALTELVERLVRE